jgi:hypothetical protein
MLSILTTRPAERRARIRARRETRAERNRLRAELANYETPAERAELEAILKRHTPEEVAELRALLR